VAIEAADGLAGNETLLSDARCRDSIVGHSRILQKSNAFSTFVSLRRLRHLVNVDPDWIIRPDVLEGLQFLAARGLSFDLVGILPRHLEHNLTLQQLRGRSRNLCHRSVLMPIQLGSCPDGVPKTES
jgi:L-fuconolactonase